MPDSETIKLGAPYRAMIPTRQSLATHDAVDAFECVVRFAPPDEIVTVATFRHWVAGYGRCSNLGVKGADHIADEDFVDGARNAWSLGPNG